MTAMWRTPPCGCASPRRQLVPDPVPVLGRNPEPDREPEPANTPVSTRRRSTGASSLACVLRVTSAFPRRSSPRSSSRPSRPPLSR